MKTLTYTILFLVFFSINSFAQNKAQVIPTEKRINKYNNGFESFYVCKNNPSINFKEDKEYFWFNELSGIKSTKGGCGGNLLHGKFQFFNEDGGLIKEKNYSLGIEDGTSKTWDEKGNLIETFKYKNGELVYAKFKSEENDNIIEWNGRPLMKGSFKNVYTNYGTLIQKEEMLDDFSPMKITEYYYNKKIKKIFKINSAHNYFGDYLEFYENGKIMIKGQFDDDIEVGDWYWYDDEGNLMKHKNLTNVNLQNIKTIKIGSQIWMSENLTTNCFINGDTIREAKTIDEWQLAIRNKQPAWCYYNNESENAKIHGCLYNGYAVIDPRGLAPKGWHIPSEEDLVNFTLTNCNNSKENFAKLDGLRSASGDFYDIDRNSYFWSSNQLNTNPEFIKSLDLYSNGCNSTVTNTWMNCGISVRLIKD